jgi:hypothetical protein
MTDDRFEDFVRRTAQDYHRPPGTPRDEMWARIVAERVARQQGVHRRPSPGRVGWGGASPSIVRWRWVRWGLAAAAVLALGIGIGRSLERRAAGGPPIASSANGAGPARQQIPAAYQIAALDHLRHVETFLTVFQSEAKQGDVPGMPELARGLLENTRLLMDSPAGRDAHMALLLDDVELVLAQIASYEGGDGPELSLIEQGIERRGLLLKLHAAIPAKYSVAGAQGVL